LGGKLRDWPGGSGKPCVTAAPEYGIAPLALSVSCACHAVAHLEQASFVPVARIARPRARQPRIPSEGLDQTRRRPPEPL
jgi:hypothetical protein